MALLVSGVYAVGAAPVLPTKQFLFSDAATYPACDERLQDLNKLFNERSICKTKSGLAMRNVSTEGNLENAPAMIVGDKSTLPNLMTPPSCHSCVALQLLRGIDEPLHLGFLLLAGQGRDIADLGVERAFAIMAAMHAISGDDRYRPSVWLRRRAQLGLDIKTPN